MHDAAVMTDKPREHVERLNAIEGADAGAMGVADPPASAPPGAEVDDADRQVPGPKFDEPIREARPWYTSLAFESDQAGVATDLDEDVDEVGDRHEDDDAI